MPGTVIKSTTPSVWIGSLHAYNCGSLVGEWTDAADLDQLRGVAERVLKEGGGEEFALMDYEGFGDLIGEYTQLERVAEIAAAIEEHGEAVIHYANYSGLGDGVDVDELVQGFEDAHVGGGYDSLKDYAEDFFHDVFDVPDGIAPYIDYEAFETSLDCDGYRCIDRHVFRPA